MKMVIVALLAGLMWAEQGRAEASAVEKKFFRDLVMRIRPQAEFKIPMPANGDMHFNYSFEFDQPLWPEPVTSDFSINSRGKKFYRSFWDKIFLKEGSYMTVGGEQIPLTCIFVAGQDNRHSGKVGPLFPDLILKVTLVANDWTCQGPINPGWPSNGGKKETWETYVHYEVKDPTIMLPTDVELRFRWNEYDAILVK